MPQADIEINGAATSNEGLPLSTLVQLSNNDVGDESTYLWELLSQPPGTADALSATNIENPTITPLKEDTYLIKLTVNQGLPDEAVDIKLFRVRRLKTDVALIASKEKTEGTDNSWAVPQNETLGVFADRVFDGTIVVAQAAAAMGAGDVVEFKTIATLKTGLPGEERVPVATAINASTAAILTASLGVVISQPDGNLAVAGGATVLCRIAGYLDVVTHAGVPTAGDPVYVSDTGVLSLAPGSNSRKVGSVVDATSGAWRAFVRT